MQVPDLRGEQYKEWAFLEDDRLLDALPEARPTIRQICSFPPGNSVPLIVLKSGNHFPAAPEAGFPMKGIFMGYFPESKRFSSGSPIAKVE
jgi:hypothetical protein